MADTDRNTKHLDGRSPHEFNSVDLSTIDIEGVQALDLVDQRLPERKIAAHSKDSKVPE